MQKHRVLVIDPSLRRTGIYYESPHEAYSDVVSTKGKSSIEALSIIYDYIRSWEHNCDLAIIEAYAPQAKGRVQTLGEVGGVIRLALYHNHTAWVDIVPSTWKSATLGGRGMPKRRKAERVAYSQRVNQLFGQSFTEYEIDEIDAFLMYQTALKSYQRSTDGLKKLNDQILKILEDLRVKKSRSGKKTLSLRTSRRI